MKIKFAIVGCGRIAQRHADHINNFGQLVGVCDVVKEKADLLAEKYNTCSFYSIDKMLSEIDADVISICSPNGLHFAHTMSSLNSGFHVLCEKPLAIRLKDCGKMIECAEKNNKRLFAIKQNRFNPPVAAVKKAIDENRFGQIYSIQLSCFWNRNEDYYANSWKGSRELDGGTLFTQFSHFIDLLYWMFGDVKTASSIMKNSHHMGIIEFEDNGVSIIEFENGIIGNINYTVNACKSNMEGSLVIFGEKGTVKIGGQYLNELEYQSFEDFEIKNLPEGNKANNYGKYQGSMSNHDLVYKNIIDVLQNNAPISASGYEGMKTVEIIEKLYSSNENK